jgi:WD40 repeat protein
MENCVAQANVQAGYSLLSSSTCTLQECKAIATGEGNMSTFGDTSNVFGFISSDGYGNIFERCIANATQALTTTDSNSVAAGFGLKGSEECSKIISCEASNGITAATGVTVPYGIWLEPQFDGLTTVTSVGGFDSMRGVSWSPDGQYLAAGGIISSGAGNDLRLYRFDRISHDLIQIASINPDEGSTAETVSAVTWSPDGKYLAVGGNITGMTNTDLYLYRFDQSSENLMPIFSINPSGASTTIDTLAWTSDGLYLAVGGTFTGGTGFDLFLYKFDQVAQILTETTSVDIGGNVRALSWSSDGLYLAVVDNPAAGASFFIYRFDRGSGTLTQVDAISPDGQSASSPRTVQWMPNGQYIALGGLINGATGNDLFVYRFNRNTETATEVFSLNPDGGSGDTVSTVNWSADGSYLAVGGSVNGTTNNDLFVYTFNAALETLTQVASTNPGGGVSNDGILSVQWSPDGNYLAVAGSINGTPNNDLIIYTGLQFPQNNVITNNTLYCSSGNRYPTGVGISGSSIANLIIGNVAYANPFNSLIIGSNYRFVCNVFNPLFGSAPTELQNIELNSKQPITNRYDIPSALNRLEVLAESLVDNLL